MISWIIANRKLLAIAALVLAVFSAGWTTRGWKAAKDTKAAEDSAEEQRIALAQQNAEVIDGYSKQLAAAEGQTRVVYRRIAALPSFKCIDDERVHFIAEWNSAATGQTDSTDTAVR